MKPYYNINIKAAMQVGLRDVDFNDLALYEFCRDAILWEDGKALWHDQRQWKWVSYDLIKTNIPYFNFSDKTLYRMLVKLCKVGLIDRCPANKKQGMVYLAIGPIGMKLERTIREFTTDKTEPDLGQISPSPSSKVSEYSNTEYSKQNIKLERETHAQEEEKQIVLEQPQIKNESLDKPKFTTLDIPTCEGHKIKIGVHEYPQQKQGIPFIHPDLIDRIPIDKRIDLWWSLYGIRQSEIKVESEMITAGLADNETFAKIYRHTFLYVAVTDERFRVPPVKYWKNRTWTDDIVDRRDKKTPTDNTGVAITNAPAAKNWIEREMDEIRRLKEWDKEEQKRWDEKIRLENEAKAANGGNAK